VDVVDCLEDRLAGEEIAVVAGTFLPETENGLPRTLRDGELAEKPAAGCFKITFHNGRDRSLDGGQKMIDRRLRIKRQGEQVDMLRHEDESDKLQPQLLTGCINALGQVATPAVVGQQGAMLVARERERMKMAWLVAVLHEFPMRRHGGECNVFGLTLPSSLMSILRGKASKPFDSLGVQQGCHWHLASEKCRETWLLIDSWAGFGPYPVAAKAYGPDWTGSRVPDSHWQDASGTLSLARPCHPPAKQFDIDPSG
jgi:hypothetical protein